MLNTIVIVAAFRSRRGASNALLRLVDEGHAILLCSTALFLEYGAVLSRARTRAFAGHSLDDVAGIVSALAALCEPVDISFRVRPLLRDPDDEMVIEVALNAPTDAIVTHNVRDFAPARALGVMIANPGEMIGRFKS